MAYIESQDAYVGYDSGLECERKCFKIRLKPFFIDVAPITCKQFEDFFSDYCRSSYSTLDDHPATLISLKMAKAYCSWRNKQEGLPESSYRLPSEYEWEIAARGCLKDQDYRAFDMHCGKEKNVGAMQIKQFKGGYFGLFDMLGNVWEWTDSIYKEHPFSDKKIENSKKYVIKGGSWFTERGLCRPSCRKAIFEYEKRGDLGFRCVRDVYLGCN
jgi:formylglycine-generating enzyme required for sulfatase activity